MPLVLSYLDREGGASLSDLVRAFCRTSRTGGRPYDEGRFVKMLIRLQRIDGPRVIRFDKVPDFGSNVIAYPLIELTKRGHEVISGEPPRERDGAGQIMFMDAFCCSFLYLQLVVDDPNLPLPMEFFSSRHVERLRRIKGALIPIGEGEAPPFLYQKQYGYEYLVRNDYKDIYINVVRHKLLKLSRFLGYLAAAQEVERRHYQAVWERVGQETLGIFSIGNVLEGIVAEARLRALVTDNLRAGLAPDTEFDTYRSAYISILEEVYAEAGT